MENNKKHSIINMYVNDLRSLGYISNYFGYSRKTITKIVKSNNIKIRSHIKINKYDHVHIINKYESGMSCIQIAKEYNCGIEAISHVLKNNNISINTIRHLAKIKPHESSGIVEKYESGMSCIQIAKEYNCNYQTISRLLKSNDIKIRNQFKIKPHESSGIVEKYESGMSCIQIAKEYGYKYPTIIADELKRNRIQVRNIEDFKIKIPLNIVKQICNMYDEDFSCTAISQKFKYDRHIITRVLKDNNYVIKKQYSVSNFQKEIFNYINTFETSILNDWSVLNKNEIDIYIPSINIGIECNGEYWHSEIHKHKMYHQNKYKMCYENGVRLIQIWEDEWKLDNIKIKQYLKSQICNKNKRIYGRKTKLLKLNSIEIKKFCTDNHLQNHVGFTVAYGLVYDNCIIQIISFTKYKNRWEITRLCTKFGISVIGGTKKLFKHFINNNNIQTKIITYANMDKFTGDVYESLGFSFDCLTKPSYFWWKKSKDFLSRQQCQKHKLIKQGFDPQLSESEIMRKRGYYKIFNAGNKKFVLKKQ